MAPELRRKLDYSDYVVMPDDGKLYEILDGNLFVNPSPSPMHQRVSRRLQTQLETFFHGRSIGEVFDAPIDLILTRHDVMVPDLVVVSDPALITDRGIEGPPLLIVDLKAKRLECHRLAGRVFRLIAEVEGDSTFQHPDLEGLQIDLSVLW